MATATLTLAEDKYPFGLDETKNQAVIYGLATFSASPDTYVAGGIAINWGQCGSMKFSSKGDGTNAGTPHYAVFYSATGSGYYYAWNRATEKLIILTGAAAQSPFTPLTDGAAIPAAVSGDTIAFKAEFWRF
jgi:hypothetical protein